MARFVVVFDTGVSADQVNAAADLVTSNGGAVTQIWGCFAIVADGDQASQDAVKSAAGVALVSATAVDQPESLNLGDDALSFVTAWNVLQSSEYQGAVSDLLGSSLSWNGILPPNGCFVEGDASDGGSDGSSGGGSIAAMVPSSRGSKANFFVLRLTLR